ncbi:GNAT family N-acetyltransferase [Ramlibacter tataouinensis]|uniref:GNAT family N-acetyltransferase n=1 Tax=Ramlibacter tataouinensis TaxID=94132 RepID=UPI0022F3D03F|nr:GNAT family N-acetyltransferase [Ramlibacter tataouinensis]WBY01276.1 GNAT family N-acetyltransferase [Ramlibacter tataouinensis]
MKISVIRAHELGPPERARWRALQKANPSLASPCFSWQFTQAAAAARPDVRVAVLEDGHKVVGFFPFQHRMGAGQPAGGRLSDHHGVVAAPGTRWDWAELLKGCRLSFWQFDHLAAWQRPPVPVTCASSPGLDLSRGYPAWLQAKLDQGSSLATLPRKLRKLEREAGPLRFELRGGDTAAFDEVIRLKSEQCRRTGQLDFFAWEWTRTLVRRVRDTDDADFGGCLSTLHAGDTLVAAHFGMHTPEVLHWWFPVYSQAHAPYSPGSLLLLEVARAAAAQGHALLDLGKGDERYKRSFADCSWPLLEGIVSRPTPLTLARQLKKRVGAWVRTSPLAAPARPLLRHLRRASS